MTDDTVSPDFPSIDTRVALNNALKLIADLQSRVERLSVDVGHHNSAIGDLRRRSREIEDRVDVAETEVTNIIATVIRHEGAA